MTPASTSTILEALNWRYATKQFDATRTIDPGTWQALEQSLVLTPSSYGLQPWKFLVIQDRALREQLVPHSWGQRQVADSSHLVVFTVRTSMSEADIDRLISATAAARGVPAESLAGYRGMMIGDVVTGPRSQVAHEWAARQAYIALGQFMLAAALAGVDTCPMEGFAPPKYDEILGLNGTGYTAVVACPAGYRAAEDKYAALAKVRYPVAEVIEHR